MPSEYLIVPAAGLISSFYGTTGGGGSLITGSVLILLGLPAHTVVATLSLGAIGRTTTGFYCYHKANHIDYRKALPLTIITGLGALLGTLLFIQIPQRALEITLIIAFCFIVIWILSNRELGTKEHKTSDRKKILGYILAFPLGIYASIVHTGTAIFANIGLISFFGMTYLQAAGIRKPIFFPSMIGIVLIYAYHNLIHWPFGITLVLSQALGAYVGSQYAIKKGNESVRWAFLLVVVLSVWKLLM